MIVLDGKQNGIFIKQNNKYVTVFNKKTKERRIKLFLNLDSAKRYAWEYVGNNCTFGVEINIDDKFISVPIDQTYKTETSYRFFHEGKPYRVLESFNEKVLNCGYFIFDSPRSDYDLIKYHHGLIYRVRKVISEFINNGYFSSISISNDGFSYEAKVANSTCKLYIARTKLVDINLKRKENKQRVFPFYKDVDQFGSVYVYFTKDNNLYENEEDLNDLVQNIISEICNRLNVEYDNVPYEGYILYKGIREEK